MDKDAGTTISQIVEKQYGKALAGYAGRILFVIVSYDKKTRAA